MILFRVFLDICLGTKGPEDLPSSRFLLGLVFVVNAVIGVIVFWIETTLSKGILEVLLSLAWLIGFTYAVLMVSGKSGRFQQTLCALLGTDIVISLIALPLLIWMQSAGDTPLPYYFIIGLMCWSMIIVGHILRHALSATYGFGLGLALLYVLGSYQLMAYFFPVVG